MQKQQRTLLALRVYPHGQVHVSVKFMINVGHYMDCRVFLTAIVKIVTNS